MCAYLLNLCLKHSVLSFFSFLCDNLLLQKRVQSLCSNNVILCVNLIDPKFTLNRYRDKNWTIFDSRWSCAVQKTLDVVATNDLAFSDRCCCSVRAPGSRGPSMRLAWRWRAKRDCLSWSTICCRAPKASRCSIKAPLGEVNFKNFFTRVYSKSRDQRTWHIKFLRFLK